MAKEFKNFYIGYLPNQQNAHADALASLAASLALSTRALEKILVLTHDLYYPRPLIERGQASTWVSHDQEAHATSTNPVQKDL